MRDVLSFVGDYLSTASFPALLLVKSTVLVVTGGLVALALRNHSASARYSAWALTLAAMVALPIGMIAVPAWRVVVEKRPPIVTDVPPRTALTTVAEPASVTPVSDIAHDVSTSMTQSLPAQLPLYIWLAGTLAVLLRMVAGRISVVSITRRASRLNDQTWTSILDRECRLLGIDSGVRLLATASLKSPVAAGVLSPVILLPLDANDWTEDHRTVVLRHELAHIARGDAFICLVAGFASAIYWFSPLVWIAGRRLRAEQEKSCDDRVITLGIAAPDYAAHLLEVARSATQPGIHGFVSVAMARPSQLEGRLLAVLHDRDRTPLSRSRRAVGAVVAFVIVAALSSLHPVIAESAVIVRSQATPSAVTAARPSATETVTGGASVTSASTTTKRPRVEFDSLVTGDVAVQSGGTLYLDLRTGASITIRGTDANRVTMRAMLGGRDWHNTWITLHNDGGDARIESGYRDKERNQSSSHRIEITVPRRFNIRISSAGGGITISDVEGTFSGETGGGEIRIDRARGSARLSTGGGPVNVFSSTLSGSVSTGGGSVLIQGVRGGLTGSSGTGDVLYGGGSEGNAITYSESSDGARLGSDGKTYVRKAGGSVTINNAPGGASISTGGGSINVGAAGGDVKASTGGGDINLGRVRGSADVSTGAGDVTIIVTPGRPVDITSGNGNVTLIIPSNLSADFDLETAFTDNHGPTQIRGDLDLSTTVTRDWDSSRGTPRRYVRSRDTVGGGGPRIKVRTVNGDIILKRR